MRDLASNSINNANCCHSNNMSHNNSQKDLNDSSNDNFSKNGLPEDSVPKKEEENDVHGRHTFCSHCTFFPETILTVSLCINCRLDALSRRENHGGSYSFCCC